MTEKDTVEIYAMAPDGSYQRIRVPSDSIFIRRYIHELDRFESDEEYTARTEGKSPIALH